jgi:hypothetical protein
MSLEFFIVLTGVVSASNIHGVGGERQGWKGGRRFRPSSDGGAVLTNWYTKYILKLTLSRIKWRISLVEYGVRPVTGYISNQLTLRSRVLPEKLTVPQLVKISPHFMEPEGSLPCSQ